MGFWSGVAKGLEQDNARRFESSEREAQQNFTLSRDEAQREFQRERDREALAATLRAQREGFVFESLKGLGRNPFITGGSGGPSGVTGGGSSAAADASLSAEHAINILVNRYDVPDELIERVAADGNPASLGKAVELLDKLNAQSRETFGRDLAPEVIVEMFDNAIVTNAKTGSVDWDKVEEYIGGAIPDELRQTVPDAFVIPGDTSFEEPVLQRQYKPEEINQARNLVKEQAMTLADDANYQIKNVLASLAEIQSSGGTLTPEQEIQKNNALEMQAELQSALEASAQGNIRPLLKMFAPDAVRYLNEYYPDLADAPLGLDFQ